MSRDAPNVNISIRARRLVDLYRKGRIQHPEPTMPPTSRIAEAARRAAVALEERSWFDPGWAALGARRGQEHRFLHPNCRCMLDPGDPAGDQTVISVQGPDGTYRRLRNVGLVNVGLVGVAHVPEDAEPLAPPPSWLPRYRPK